MEFFIHEKGICESFNIGSETKIWAFAHVLPKAVIGHQCNICENVFIENDVIIGDRVTIKNGVQLWDGIVIENDVFIGPNATFTNDLFPRSKDRSVNYLKTTIQEGASIGANATILPGIKIGAHAMVGAGAVVTMSVPPYAVVVGNPACIINYVGSEKSRKTEIVPERTSERASEISYSNVKGVTIHHLPNVNDMRGKLSVGEFDKNLPFIPKRYFLVYDVPNAKIRGQHTHRECKQFLVCIKGSCAVLVDDGKNRQEYLLDKPNCGIYIPPMVWSVQYNYSSDAVLLVFASEHYEEGDYIRNYNEFQNLVQ